MRMIKWITCLSMLPCVVVAIGQQQNPFDLKWRLSAEVERGVKSPLASTDSTLANTNPVVSTPNPVSADSSDLARAEGVDSSIAIAEVGDDMRGDTVSAIDANTAEESPIVAVEEPSEPIDESPVDRTSDGQDNGTLLLLFGVSLLLVTWATTSNRGFVRKVYRAALNENFSALLMREHKFMATQYLYYVIYASFFIHVSIFIYLLSTRTKWIAIDAHLPTLTIMGIALCIYVGRHGFLKVLGTIFPVSQELSHFSFNIVLYNILAGLLLMPLNLLLAFGPSVLYRPIIYLIFAGSALIYLFRQFRGVVIGYHVISKHPFQFFVYLCAIEILPVLVLVKFFITD